MEKFNKKTVWKFVIGIVALLLIIIGATYAYFTLSVQNLTDTTRVTGNVEDVGSVALKLENNIYMNLKAYDMQKWENDVTYYASTKGATTEETEEVIAYTQATGNHTYTCTYTLEVTDVSTNSTYNAFQNMSTKSDGQIVLTVDGKDYDFNTNSLFPLTIDGVIDNVSSTSVGEIKAKYKMVNSSAIDQSALAGTDMKLEFKATKFECEVDNRRLLAVEVMGESEKYTIEKPDYENAVSLTQDEYLNMDEINVEFYGWDENWENSIEEIVTIDNDMTFSDGKWNLNVNDLYQKGYESITESSTLDYVESLNFKMSTNVKKDGYYQLCVIDPNGSYWGYLDIIKNDLYITSESLEFYESYQERCVDIGKLSSSEVLNIKIGSSYYGEENVELLLYLKNTEKLLNTINVGYRYSGSNPDNYISFNNETWRIIGTVPTCRSENCYNSENLVKIIRQQSLVSVVYDTFENYASDWGKNTLYKQLNNYYYGSANGTNAGGCYSLWDEDRNKYTKTTCDYTNVGINPDSEYGKMIENVYWNTGEHDTSDKFTPSSIYEEELKNQTITGYVGIMAASDFGYASDKDYHNKSLGSGDITKSNWMYIGIDEWVMTKTSRLYYVTNDWGAGQISMEFDSTDYGVRPVVYLDKNVQIIDGTGTEDDPYQISLDEE